MNQKREDIGEYIEPETMLWSCVSNDVNIKEEVKPFNQLEDESQRGSLDVKHEPVIEVTVKNEPEEVVAVLFKEEDTCIEVSDDEVESQDFTIKDMDIIESPIFSKSSEFEVQVPDHNYDQVLEDESVKGNHKTKSTDSRIQCKICGLMFRNIYMHMLTHEHRLFSCKVCNKNFSQRGNLNIHMATHDGVRPFSCKVCKKDFSQKGNLRTHMVTHTGDRPFSCEVCGKSFARKYDLGIHTRKHRGEFIFVCDLCGKSFSHKDYLIRHMYFHTRELPYSCEVCSKSFSNKSNLNRHMYTHTGIRPFSCQLCTKSFSEKGKLIRHLRTHAKNQEHFPF